MKDLKKLCIDESKNLRVALGQLNDAGYGTLFVVNDKMQMVGLITDGDVRRGLLRGLDMHSKVSEVMNAKFISGTTKQKPEAMLHLLRRHQLRQLPILDENRVLVDALMLDDLGHRAISNPVVLMVGGRGTRLLPLTERVPKPMVSVGGKPILESILEQYIQQGFHKFYFAVNYKAQVIESHFGDGNAWGVEIEYLREEETLGTAGALSLLPKMTSPFLVMNGDLLTDLDFSKFLNFHLEQQTSATVAVSAHQLQVQYGVVEFEKSRVTRIVEKPFHEFFVNAGVYAVSPECLELVKPNTFLDMPTMITQLLNSDKKVSAYSLEGYWKDIGRIADLDQARRDFKKTS